MPGTRIAVLLQNFLAQLVKKLPAFTKPINAAFVHNKAPNSKIK